MNRLQSLTLGRIAGIEIGIHSSWLFIAALVAWSLAHGYYPAAYPGWPAPTYWVAAVISALALFGSVLVHELAHSLVAQARGTRVQRITLFIFGGVSAMREEPAKPLDEFLVAIVGPATSVLLGAGFWAAHVAVEGLGLRGAAGAAGVVTAAILGYLGVVNLLLGAFNLLPGFPLDGGRVLRSLLWWASGSLRRATEWASYAGQGIGFVLLVWGVSRAFGGSLLNGLWMAFIGWFLATAAEATRHAVLLRESLRGIRVADFMDPQPATAQPEMSVHEFVLWHVLRRGRRALPVVEDGRLVGIVTVTDVKELPQPEWPTTPVSQIMKRAPLLTVAPDAEINTALRLMVEGGVNQVPVVDGGRLVGLLSRADVLRFIQLREELHVNDPERPGPYQRPVGAEASQPGSGEHLGRPAA
jgi:Zn-dependent protease